MGWFSRAPKYSQKDLVMKMLEGKRFYDQKNYALAKKSFQEYLVMKPVGVYPEMDKDDWMIRMNIVLCNFYLRDYSSAANGCDELLRLNPSFSDAYSIKALSKYKLGAVVEARQLWTRAQHLGSQMATMFDDIEDFRMPGYNE